MFSVYSRIFLAPSRLPHFITAFVPASPAYPQYILTGCFQLCILRRDRCFAVQTGVFAAEMMVNSENDGPITIILDTDDL